MFLLLVIIIIMLNACYMSGTIMSMINPNSLVGFNCYPHFAKKEPEAQCLYNLLIVL